MPSRPASGLSLDAQISRYQERERERGRGREGEREREREGEREGGREEAVYGRVTFGKAS